MEAILKELIGIQISSNAVILNLKWAILIPMLLIQLWMMRRTVVSFFPKKRLAPPE